MLPSRAANARLSVAPVAWRCGPSLPSPVATSSLALRAIATVTAVSPKWMPGEETDRYCCRDAGTVHERERVLDGRGLP